MDKVIIFLMQGSCIKGENNEDEHSSAPTLPGPPSFRVMLPALLPGIRSAGLGVFIINDQMAIYIKAMLRNSSKPFHLEQE